MKLIKMKDSTTLANQLIRSPCLPQVRAVKHTYVKIITSDFILKGKKDEKFKNEKQIIVNYQYSSKPGY